MLGVVSSISKLTSYADIYYNFYEMLVTLAQNLYVCNIAKLTSSLFVYLLITTKVSTGDPMTVLPSHHYF